MNLVCRYFDLKVQTKGSVQAKIILHSSYNYLNEFSLEFKTCLYDCILGNS